MALLGLFSKRDKGKSSNSSTTAKSSGASVADSLSVADTSEYAADTKGVPALPNNVYGNSSIRSEASSSKFHLGFRKKSTPAADVSDNSLLRPPQVPYSPSSRSEADLDSIRPPDRTTLFTAYADSKGALSTRSLPTQSDDTRGERGRTSTELPPAPKKGGGLFSWAHRERKKSKVADEPPSLNVDVGNESFNLKSFRHIGPESPSNDSPLSNNMLIPPAIPRPRGNSASSVDSSQRISVAAFREMAARRSAANSPTPSPVLLRPPSRTDSLEHSHLRQSGAFSQRVPPVPARTSTLGHNQESSSESEDSGESESEDSAGSSTMRPKRQRTITQKSATGKSTSELGHRPRKSDVAAPLASRSALGHGADVSPRAQPSQRPQPATGQGFYRSRASHSTSALQPNAAAKRASLLIAERTPSSNSSSSAKGSPVQVSDRARSKSRARDSDSDSSDSSSEDSDDAPLATFMRPPRPGSSASNATSGSRSRMPTKPLIDISQMGTPPIPPFAAAEKAASSPSTRDKQFSPPVPEKDPTSPTTSSPETRPGSRPTHSEKPSISDRLARVAQGAAGKSVERLASAAPLERKSLDARPAMSSDNERDKVVKPTRSQTAPFGKLEEPDSSMSSTKPKPNGRTLSSPNAAALYDLTDTAPIIPMPIRERSPPPAFSVTSRPASQLSLNSNGRLSGSQSTVRIVGPGSTASSPTSPTSITSSFKSPDVPQEPRISPFASSPISSPPSRPSPGGRQRSSTLIPNSGLGDSSGFTGGGLLASAATSSTDVKTPLPSAMRGSRQRSSTMLPHVDTSPPPRTFTDRESATSSNSSRAPSSNVSPPTSSQAQPSSHRFPQRPRVPFSGSSTSSPSVPSPQSGLPPPKPFAISERGNSPASSTGDSSSGRMPLTPADGSEVGHGDSRSVVSGLSGPRKGHRRGGSGVTFEDEDEKGRGRPKTANQDEERRKERRRSEAKAAIELGKVVNGKITLPDDDDDDLPLNGLGPRMSMANPMMNFTPPSPMPFAQPGGANMMAPQFMMPPPNADPRFLAAHQHAMMVAKQAYQMAVAQQALAAANEEWERGSSVSAFGGMGMNSGMSMNMNMGAPGMAPMPGMMPGMYGMGWNNPMMFPSSASMYAGSVAGSELGVPGGGAGWGSRSEYGGPGRNSRTSQLISSRSSSYGFDQQSTSPSSSRPPIRPRTKTSPSDGPVPAQHRTRQAPPPSSWRNI